MLTDPKILSLLILDMDRRLKSLSLARGPRGPQGANGTDGVNGKDGVDGKDGRDGRDFNFAEYEDTLRTWISEASLTFDKLTEEQKEILRGPRGHDGRDGKDGNSFSMADYEETLRTWIAEASLTFDKLTEEQKEQLRGPRGKDGKDFSLQEYESILRGWIKESSLKFSDLSEAELETLRGPRGFSGKDGRDGKDGLNGKDGEAGKGFIFEEHKDEILEALQAVIPKFSSLSDAEKEELRGYRGRDGKDGKDFVFEDHEASIFDLLVTIFSNNRESLKLKFSDLSHEEVSQLKLKFSDLNPEEVALLKGERGPRGHRGQVGKNGKDGADGINGTNGKDGVNGKDGRNGVDGKNGKDGIDAPYVTDVRLLEEGDYIYFRFYYSDNTYLDTNRILRPKDKVVHSYVLGGGRGGGGGEGTPGVEIISEDGPLGTKRTIEFSDDFVVTDESADKVTVELKDKPTPVTIYDNGTEVGQSQDLSFDDGIEVEIDVDGVARISATPPTISVDGVVVAQTRNIDFSDDFTAEYDSVTDTVNISAVDKRILRNYTCDGDVTLGDVVFLYRGVMEATMHYWVPLEVAEPISYDMFFPQVGRADASYPEKSRPLGICVARYTDGNDIERCDIQIMGETGHLFGDLDLGEDYFLSNFPGVIVKESELDLNPGEYRVRVGQPASETTFIFSRGDRSLVT